MIQDIEPKHLYNEWKKNAVPKKSSAVVQFRGQDLLCRIDDNGLKFPSRAQFTEPDEAFTYLFELDGREYYLLFDENECALDGYSYRNIGLSARKAQGARLCGGQRVAPLLMVPRRALLRPLRGKARPRWE